ncbi:MAG: ABC transporter permease [Anaerolineae bacterium]|jgi:peptide/nickel transport system permease protein|nr:ABC transporter permease [Anaerolineae bacterium]
MTEETITPVPAAVAAEEPASDVGELSQWQLIWLRFRRNRLAMGGMVILAIMYLVVIFAGFLSPNAHDTQNLDYIYGPPDPITFVGPNGKLGLRPYTFATTTVLNQATFKWDFEIDRNTRIPIQFFVRGDTYKILWWRANLHLMGIAPPDRLYVWGADSLGRDMFARTLVGGQVSMTVGLVGIALTIFLGSVLGTISGFFGGTIDDAMQRVIEVIQSFPTIPLWAALAAALPNVSESFTMLHRYFLITVILSLVNWTGLARQLRAKVMSYRQADFTSAALVAGASNARIIFVHMLPNAASHIIVVAALAIPGMILGETSLSFLGLGIQPPMVSWGALLRDSQQVSTVVQHPWLILPGIGVVITVLGFSVLGDGLRDAVDPYSI